MKYPRLDMGTMEAVVNKVGGMEGVNLLLGGYIKAVHCDAQPWKITNAGKPDQVVLARVPMERFSSYYSAEVKRFVRKNPSLGFELCTKEDVEALAKQHKMHDNLYYLAVLADGQTCAHIQSGHYCSLPKNHISIDYRAHKGNVPDGPVNGLDCFWIFRLK